MEKRKGQRVHKYKILGTEKCPRVLLAAAYLESKVLPQHLPGKTIDIS
jgi:hypothetical protein